jgi:hypothetical protein
MLLCIQKARLIPAPFLFSREITNNMSTAAQINANRQNAQHSTGPTSTTGRARSSQNSFRHGLASSQLIVPGESQADFEALLAGLISGHNPQSTIESILVHNMATHHWLKLRSIKLQSGALSDPESTPASINIYMRYQVSNERGFWKCFDTLRKLQKERAEAEPETEIGFVSQSTAKPAPVAAPAAEPTPESAPQPAPQTHPMWQKHPIASPVAPKRQRY